MANKVRLLEVAALLRVPPPGFSFDMRRILLREPNGSLRGCIAGITLVQFDPSQISNDRYCVSIDADDDAGRILELTIAEENELFFPDSTHLDFDLRRVNAAMAADVVERFALTGEISWPKEVMGEEEDE